MKREAVLFAPLVLAAFFGPLANGATAAPTRLPVFTVERHGVTPGQARALQRVLALRSSGRRRDGSLLYVNDDLFQRVPTRMVAGQAGPDEDDGTTFTEAFDFDAIRRLRTLGDRTARSRAARAFRRAGLAFSGRGVISHSEFNAFDARGVRTVRADVDTQVSYPQRLRRIPLIGPGSKAKLIFDRQGRVTYLRYAFRRLRRGPTVRLLSRAVADRIARAQFGALCAGQAGLQGLVLRRSLVYFAPPLSRRVRRIFPHYEYRGTALIGGQRVTLKPLLLPAIRSGRPRARLRASASGATVTARTSVRGGRPPYSFRYGSCQTTLSPREARGGRSTSYVLAGRDIRPTRDTVSVLVTDADGLQTTARRDVTLPVTAARRRPGAFAAIPNRKDVATEWIGDSQGLPDAAENAYDFRDEMSDISTIQFNWGDNNVFESDFVDPSLPGGDDSDWADNVDFIYFYGHGNPSGFATGKTQGDGFVDYSQVKWGNRDMEWIALSTCLTLKESDGGLTLNERWAPRMKGVHTLLGYASLSYDIDSEGNELGDGLADEDRRVRTAWVVAANEQPSGVVWLYTGPIGAGGVTNYNDYFHGIGSVTKDITTLAGYYYYKGTV